MFGTVNLFYQETDANILEQYEVISVINNSEPRRVCICDRKQDASDIVIALKFAYKKGII